VIASNVSHGGDDQTIYAWRLADVKRGCVRAIDQTKANT
jgi:hypothetical protein